MKRDLLTLKETAQYLGLSEKTIRNMVKGRSIPFCRIGGQYRFISSELEKWLASKMESPAAGMSPDSLKKLDSLKNPLEKRLLFMGILTERLKGHRSIPVVVGGNALEFYTLGGYATGDIDIIFPDRNALDSVLLPMGFTREGRHWYHAGLDIAIEAPPGPLAGDANRVSKVEVEGFIVYIIAVEDLVIDRLNAFVHWSSGDDGFWAKELLLLFQTEIDWSYLLQEAGKNKVEKQLLDMKREIDHEGI